MTGSRTDAELEKLVSILSPEQFAQLRLVDDQYGIYAERRALGRVLPGGVQVYRGTEWFHG